MKTHAQQMLEMTYIIITAAINLFNKIAKHIFELSFCNTNDFSRDC